MPVQKRLAAEFIGTLWLVLGGCGNENNPALSSKNRATSGAGPTYQFA
jgi:glycerol uptake facilitator-like aquaporin